MKYLIITFLVMQNLFAIGGNSYMEGLKIAKDNNKKLLLMVTSKYCGWCNKMKKTTLKDKEILSIIDKNFVFVEVDKNGGDYPRNLVVRGVPAFFVISNDNYLLDKFIGYQKKNRFLTHLRDNSN